MAASIKTAPAPDQWVPSICDCHRAKGTKGGQYLFHYDRLICSCGKTYWALLPKRGGPLVMFPWPGHNLSREQMKELYPEAPH